VRYLYGFFLGAQITKNQMKNARLPLSTANCTDTTNTTGCPKSRLCKIHLGQSMIINKTTTDIILHEHLLTNNFSDILMYCYNKNHCLEKGSSVHMIDNVNKDTL
jgi:hypothetical protein